MRPEILAAAATARVVLGALSADVADALSAVEAWASGAEAVDPAEAAAHLDALGLRGIDREATHWLVASVVNSALALPYVEDCLDALGHARADWPPTRVDALYRDILAGLTTPPSEQRDTLPCPAPGAQEAA